MNSEAPVESRLRQSRRPPVESQLRQSRRPPVALIVIARNPHRTETPARTTSTHPRGQIPQLIVAWLLVGIPLAYGIYETLLRAAKLFTG